MLFRLLEMARGWTMPFPFWLGTRGKRGEYLARRYFHRRGYHLLAKNWRSGRWELDAVMANGKRVLFLEVKTRAKASRMGIEDAVTPAQKKRLQALAPKFLAQWPDVEVPWRLLLVRVVLQGRRHHIQVQEL